MKMFKTLAVLSILALNLAFVPRVLADGGVFASGGGTKTAGTTFTVSVVASGATFDSLQGSISISGPVTVVSFSPGGATWLPGKTPSNGGQFVGIVSETTSLTVATIKLKGTTPGSGAVSVSNVKLADKGSIVATTGDSASFTIARSLQVPTAPTVTSADHPDPNTATDVTTISLAWTKASGVTGFSYVLDQVADTTPASKANTTDTSIVYQNQAVGVYYFHIKAQNGDGWGSTTHFTITIKEPDAKVNDQLSKPSDIKVAKASDFINDVTTGFFTGVIISGKTEPGYTANIILDPAPTLPEGKTLTALADKDGNFELLMDFPLKSGFYKMTVQGQLLKVLTPMSDQINFEISQAKGGKITILSDSDKTEPVVIAQAKNWYGNLNKNVALYVGIGLAALLIVVGGIILIIRRRKKF